MLKGKDTEIIHVHTTSMATALEDGTLDLSGAFNPEHTDEKICATAPVFVTETESDGSLTGVVIDSPTVSADGMKITHADIKSGKTYFVDFYMQKTSSKVSEIQIDAENFGGYYYVEATTLFRRQSDGVDMPAELTFPNVKIQSNFTFNMASTGDPSTFTFTMDELNVPYISNNICKLF